MLRYILNRIGIALLIVWGVLTVTFLIIHLAPGDPSLLYVKPEIDPNVVDNIRDHMGFNLPIWQQYFVWSSEFLQGNFGFSFLHYRPVNSIFAEAIPNTIKLTLVVFVLQLAMGIFFGVISALKQNSKVDLTLNTFLYFLYAMPSFWLALIAVMIFSLKLGWLPSSQMNSLQTPPGFWLHLVDSLRHMILPATILSIPFIAYTTRFVRGNLINILKQPYIITAKAYGIKKNKILYQYALKNALLPIITQVGLYLPFILGGAVIIEYIFAWPGMGSITVNAIFSHDFPVILASNFIAALTVVFGNLLSDLLYLFADPRIRVDKTVRISK